ncbi:MAG TPA: M15 family metallopeptidase [Streptosporangiaceae bacterium]|nr:M15 family metallopeptidase [Streptosporangiaceae bacterium]
MDCQAVALPAQPARPPVRRPAAARPDAPVKENDEPLVPLAGAVATCPVYSWLGFRHGPGPLRLRAGVVSRLQRASRQLPPDFEIVVIDAHRTRAFQAELLAYYQAAAHALAARPAGTLDGYVADPWSDEPVPPHTTGGAVDLTLGWRGAALGLGTDFDAFVPQAAPAALEHPGGGPARDLRRLLAAVLRDEGMTVLPTEWWHWSYGDQHWAAAAGEPAAHYGECS